MIFDKLLTGCWGGSSEGLAVVLYFFSWEGQQVSGYELLLQLTVQPVPARGLAGGPALLTSNPMLLFTDVFCGYTFSLKKPASSFIFFTGLVM